MEVARLDAADLPVGTKVVSMPVLEFDFLEAIQKFKKTLPYYYIEGPSWFEELKQACVILIARHKNSTLSLLYLQLDFLTCVYRGVHGSLATEASWEKMKAKLSTEKNGSVDHLVMSQDLFDEAMLKETDEGLINYIAEGGNLSLDEFIVMTPIALETLTEPYDGEMEFDRPDTWPSGLRPAYTATFSLSVALEGIKKKKGFDDEFWLEQILKDECRTQLEALWNGGVTSLLFLQLDFIYQVYKRANDKCKDSENPWYTISETMLYGRRNSMDDDMVDRTALFTSALEKATAADFIQHLSQGLRPANTDFVVLADHVSRGQSYIIGTERCSRTSMSLSSGIDWEDLFTGALEQENATDLIAHLAKGNRPQDTSYLTFASPEGKDLLTGKDLYTIEPAVKLEVLSQDPKKRKVRKLSPCTHTPTPANMDSMKRWSIDGAA
ncbi:uncharacterized protein PG986_000776 [Apiospora aurea]|uniref:Uncharacterized protein n=1 Tax=Apiospora aurea TaxID=335848 RepID=A0ABR1QV07_9PEZI